MVIFATTSFEHNEKTHLPHLFNACVAFCELSPQLTSHMPYQPEISPMLLKVLVKNKNKAANWGHNRRFFEGFWNS